jgi:hypothetical protein
MKLKTFFKEYFSGHTGKKRAFNIFLIGLGLYIVHLLSGNAVAAYIGVPIEVIGVILMMLTRDKPKTDEDKKDK